ncbi:matrix-remodeling-associated protein 5-like [Conger conger]|uniref:matrix-remodeling-associated protein 5-like n=1 Tax=Conger conger TaxID=82655 RepID=UPI002A5A806D|nr:matrix-remodeling-associated protein 5-like [Conger conger]
MTVICLSHLWAVALLPMLLALPLMTQACPGSCSCPGSREVLCTFSDLNSLPPAIPRDTQRLNLGYNNIQALDGSEFRTLRSLEMLMLHGNDIQSLSSRAFYNLRSLWILKLSHNKLRNITLGIFEGLSRLVSLYLDHNSIEFIEPFSFSGLTSLTLLNLEGNRLRDLHPHTFVTLYFLGNFWGSSLRYLHLSDNQLRYLLPGTLQDLNKLEALSVYGNPWACDCNLQWLLQWNNKNKGVIKCLNEEGFGTSVNCAMCSSPQTLNNSQVFQLSTSQLSCDRPTLQSPLKLRDSTVWLDTTSDIPYIKDLDPPLGHITFKLSDSHSNMAHVDCVVRRQAEGSTMSWQKLRFPSRLALNVTLMSLLECEINRDDLQQLWRLIAYYYERPAILTQGLRQENASRATFQYSQAFIEDAPYFTDLRGYFSAEPTWLLQPLLKLQLNRRKSTSKTLVLNFSTFISKRISVWEEQRVTKCNWAFVHRGTPGKVHTVLEGSGVSLDCEVSSSGQASVEWMLPDFSILNTSYDRIAISENDKLVIHKASPSDSGLYHCLVRSEVDVDIMSFRVFVKERVLSSDHINGKEMSLDSGESLTLPCSMSSVEPSDMTWHLPTNTILWPSSSEGRIKILSNGSLVIINATYEDDGVYSCLAVNLYGADMLSHRIVIRVFPEGRTPTPPTFHPPKTGEASKIKDFGWFSRLRNRYRQHKLNAYRLSQAGKNITPKANIFNPRPLPTPMTMYSAVTPAYSLLATNQAHSTIQNYSQRHYSHQGPKKLNNVLPSPSLIESGRKPKISSVNTNSLSALIETDVSLPCESLGEPRPSLSWTKVSTGATIEVGTKNGERFEVLRNGTFMIKTVQLQDRGQYLCTAKNAFGSDQVIITLLVMNQPPKIVPPKSTDMLVYVGHPIYLDCMAEGKPQAQISWILPDGKIVQGRGLLHNTVSVLTNGTLSIKVAHLSSTGQYKCIASSTAGADTLTYHIHVVNSSPTINEEATEVIVLPTGSNAYIHCTAIGEPKPTIQWTIPDEEKGKAFPVIRGRISVLSNGTLFVRNISLTDSGTYQCSATNRAGATRRVVRVEVKQENSSTQQPLPLQHRITGMYGSTVYLHCSGSATSQHGALWRLPFGMFLDYQNSSEGSITAFPNSTLRIQQLTEKEAGSYLCLFLTPHGQDFKLFQVEVLPSPPKIKRFTTVHKRVAYGDSFQIDCLASGFPAPEVSWTLPEGTIVKSTLQYEGELSHNFIVFENGTLLLKQISRGDEGDYTCNARNTFGQDVMKVRIHLLPDSPRILSKDEVSIWGLLGKPVQIKCQASGEPTPTITWYSPSNATIATSSIRYQILGDGTLIIRKLGSADRGNYACVAKSLAGYDVKNVHLEVEGGSPRINRQVGRTAAKVSAVFHQTLLLDCKAEGLPEPRVTWTTSFGINLPTPYLGGRFRVYRNGSLELHNLRKTDEGQYVCRAQNSLGEARLEIDLKVKSLTEKPSFATANTEVVSFKPGSAEVTLACYASGNPTPELVWVLPNSTVLIAGVRLQRFHHIPANGFLHILQPGNGDMGVYRCLANNTAGKAQKQFSLEQGWKPWIQGKPTSVRISFGQNLNLPCPVDAWPQAAISWTLPNSRILRKPQVIGRVAYLGNGALELSEAATVDGGTYTCKATNAFGSSTLSHTVIVTVYPPRITNVFPSIIVVNRGSAAMLRCRAVGIPKPDISWTLPGSTSLTPTSPITAQNGMHITAEGSLVIQNPMLTHSGTYKCNARSAVGMDFKATYIQVL